MNCSLEKKLKAEHSNMRDPRMGAMTHQCPLFDKQICYWCCLHIHDAAQPMTRVMSTDKNLGYAQIAEIAGRTDLDDVWTTCSKCGRGS